ncbi:hypothetical protein QTJ16_001522 [Diplocarpon rosae]|uniref:SUN domain-containing protein n=1 Tax=Diplocarpon rosae TaxID=946125 RepID=A0AAD9T4G7_9HELO|nr:hypothetical protein QTJ16_001522 [Diplocarpon rosae]
MHFVRPHLFVALLLAQTTASANTSSITSFMHPSQTTAPATCEFRTINYITDSLPQQCLKSSWSSANSTTTATATATEGAAQENGNEDGTQTVGRNETSSDVPVRTGEAAQAQGETTAAAADAAVTDLETGELNEASFLSFEEWKKQTLEKAGQANANIGVKRSGSGEKKRDSESIQNNLDSLGEEAEIDLDFGAFRTGGREEAQAKETKEEVRGEGEVEEKKREHGRSKDAGKTCKERLSYASFDAGATILKTHPGAKNSKAVLIENKDSYMLSECKTENKFIIIELSEDIWIDTVVLANYEFFSSMIRTFRVSLSDRYPVKIDKWKDAGTYEARNSREIQAFLIANPQIWARYIRIEFLSHYGNEYYCPLSLVRVHGTRMLESWKETEANEDGDEPEEIEAGGEEQFVPEAVAEAVQIAENPKAANDEMVKTGNISNPAEPLRNATDGKFWSSYQRAYPGTTLWEQPGAYIFRLQSGSSEMRASFEALVSEPAQNVTICTEGDSVATPSQQSTRGAISASLNAISNTFKPTASRASESMVSQNSTIQDSATAAAPNSTNSTSDDPVSPLPTASTTQKTVLNPTVPKNKTTSTTSSSSSLPTIQESFFKAVSRRLNFLETNSTLSLKYIEEQSRILREAFTKVEKKQLQKTNTFLETLNSTVLSELRQFRQQYDEIWQSTVISLESQRDESRREILAISSRLNILADEVVFQKRMSIVQSVLLLLCLALVIFSRVSAGTNFDFPSFNSRVRLSSGFPIESPPESPRPESPEYRGANVRAWPRSGHPRHLSDDEGPPTPVSAYSHDEEVESTSPSVAEDIQACSRGDVLPNSDSLPPSETHTPAKRVPTNTSNSYSYLTDSPQTRTSKKQKRVCRQRDSSVGSSGVGESPQVPTIEIQESTPGKRLRKLSDSSSLNASQEAIENGFLDVDLYPEQEDPQSQSVTSHLPSPLPDLAFTQEGQQSAPTQAPANIELGTNNSLSSPPASCSPESSNGNERRRSLSIARKPLPALPFGS